MTSSFLFCLEGLFHVGNLELLDFQGKSFICFHDTVHPRTTHNNWQGHTPLHTVHHKHTHSVLTGDVNAHSNLWHSYTDDHRGQIIADVISNLHHITLNTNTPTRVPNTTLQQASSPDITTVSNTLYNRTSWTTQHALSSDHLPIITTINIRHDYRLQQSRRPFTNYKKADWTQITEDTESRFRSDHHNHQYTHCQHIFYKDHTDGRQAQHTKGQDAYQLQDLPAHIVAKSHKGPT